jgi:hypothetical protein
VRAEACAAPRTRRDLEGTEATPTILYSLLHMTVLILKWFGLITSSDALVLLQFLFRFLRCPILCPVLNLCAFERLEEIIFRCMSRGSGRRTRRRTSVPPVVPLSSEARSRLSLLRLNQLYPRSKSTHSIVPQLFQSAVDSASCSGGCSDNPR